MMMTAVARNIQAAIPKAMGLALRPTCPSKTRKRNEQTSTFLEQHLVNQYSHKEEVTLYPVETTIK